MTSSTPSETEGLLLPSLDGTNPLGFLAALGLFRIMGAHDSGGAVRMAWKHVHGTWVPRLYSDATDSGALLDRLQQNLVPSLKAHASSDVISLDEKDSAERRRQIENVVSSCSLQDRTGCDWLAAMASDAAPPSSNTQLQTVRRDYFKGNLASVMERTTRDHLERSLFHIWDYADALDNQSLHFDPSEDRRHAHQWNRPSGDPDRKKAGGMLGANRLALEALPLFVSIPEQDQLHTLGFTGFRSWNTRWTWPIWRPAIDLKTTRSVLALADTQDAQLSEETIRRLTAMGIAAVFRTRRILVGKTPNFTPAQRVA